MKIDPERVRSLRQARHWSQEQLAEACGLNLRTIQRLEASGRASNETLRALAAVFEVEPASLIAESVAADGRRSALDAVRSELLRYDDFTGRSNRHDYWWFLLACALVLALGLLVHPTFQVAVSLVLVVPLIAAGTRRLRDSGESPWWQLFWLVPIAGLLVLWLQTRPSVAGVDAEAQPAG